MMSEVAAIGFSYRTILDKNARREIVFQTHVASDSRKEDIDTILDKMGQAASRQAAIYELEEAEINYANNIRRLEQCEEHLVMLDETNRASWEAAGRRGDFDADGVPNASRMARDGALQSVKKWRDDAAYAKIEVERLRAVVHGNAYDERADSHVGMSGRQNTGNGAAGGPEA